jgi:hypothetical protein
MSITDPSTRPDDALANDVLVAGQLLALDEFIADVLRRAHQSEPGRSPNEHRTIFHVAHMFADELERTDPTFNRTQFIETVAKGFCHA